MKANTYLKLDKLSISFPFDNDDKLMEKFLALEAWEASQRHAGE